MAKKDANEILLELKAENKLLRDKLDESKKEITKLTGNVEKSSKKIGSFFKKVGAVAIAYISGKTVKAITELAGELDSVEGSFYNLAAGAEGGAQGLLKAMQTASKGTVDNLSLMRSSNLAFQLMGEQVAEHLPKMMEVATAAARAQGKKVSDMFNDIVVASGRRSVMILDNLGISSSTAAKYQDEFAASLGKTRDQLNDTQKSQAFFYAVMKAGGDTLKAIGNEGLTLGERLQIMDARFKNAGQIISQTMIPALENLVGAFMNVDITGSSLFNRLVKGAAHFVNRIAYAIKIMEAWASKTNDQYKKVADVAEGYQERVAEYQEKLKKLYEEDTRSVKEKGKNWLDMARIIKQGSGDSLSSIEGMQKVMKEMGFSHEQVTSVHAFFEQLSQSNKVSQEAVELAKTQTKSLETIRAEYEKAEAEIENFNLRRIGNERNTQRQMTQVVVDEAARRQMLENQAKVAEYVGEFEQAELIRKQLEYEALLELKTGYEKDAKAIEDAYAKKRLLAENEAAKKRFEANQAYHKARLGMMSVEWESLKDITANSSALMTSNNKTLFKMGKALAYTQALMNAAEAITKAWAQGGFFGGAMAAVTAAATGAQIGKIKATSLPSYQKGFVPVLAQGTVPQNHYPAYIGTDEAVITGRATAANADILREMNSTGKRVDTGKTINVNQNVNFSGNVLSKDYVNNHVIPELKTQARYMGKELFAEKR